MISGAEHQGWQEMCARGVRRLVALTGAGISAESGIPTFRSAGGLWRGENPMQVATPEAFRRDPARVWAWYENRRQTAAGADPNPGHLALVRMEAEVEQLTVITQNVDGLHQRAGSRQVLELHGSLWRVRCTDCGSEAEDLALHLDPLPPVCQACGGMLRPAVVWFGERLPAMAIAAALKAALQADVMLVIGTSALVHPAAGIPLQARGSGTLLVEVNPEATPLSTTVDLSIRGTAATVLPELAEGLRQARGMS